MITQDLSSRAHLGCLFRQIVEGAPNSMVMMDRTGLVQMVNAQTEQVFGYARNEIEGRPIERLLPERFHPVLRHALSDLRRSGPLSPDRDLYALHRDGGEFPVEIGLNPIQTDDGPMLLLAIVNLSRRKNEEARIRAALKEKDILLGEIHHRVKNNLQIVHSLLHLQSVRITDPVALELLRDSQNRIHSMALIHQTLYQSRDFAGVDFALFIDRLLPALLESYGVDTDRIGIHVDVEPVRLPIDLAVPCGLVVNELITNVLKHAFRGREFGEVQVTLTRPAEDEALLSVSDNGVGLPDHVDSGKTDTLGLQLVALLASQLDGAVSIHRCQPTRFSVRFPI